MGGRLLTLDKPTLWPTLWPTPSLNGSRLLRRRLDCWGDETSPSRRGVAWRETILLPRAGALIEPWRGAQSPIGSAFCLRASQGVGNTNILSLHLAASSPHLCTLSISSLLWLMFASDRPRLPSPPWQLSARGTRPAFKSIAHLSRPRLSTRRPSPIRLAGSHSIISSVPVAVSCSATVCPFAELRHPVPTVSPTSLHKSSQVKQLN